MYPDQKHYTNDEKLKVYHSSYKKNEYFNIEIPRLVGDCYINGNMNPTETYGNAWLHALYQGDSDNIEPYFIDTVEYMYHPSRMPEGWATGKWMVFTDDNNVNSLWRTTQELVLSGTFWREAKVSTRANSKGSYVICIYTPDHNVKYDMWRINNEIKRLLGINRRLPYKSNYMTLKGINGSLYYY